MKTVWPKSAKVGLAIGVVLWLSGIALLPGELAAARKKTKVGPRTAATAIFFAAAAVLVLYGLPRVEKPPELPSRT
ncbi:MAG: hypothetical protein ACXVEE_22865 [Polyangiales bacterium]